MRVLGIDTATAVAATGVVDRGAVLSDVSEIAPAGHGGCLPALVARALELARLRVEDLDGIAVSVGPGSFTGLRVGLSFAKGMAFSGGCRLVGVATLEALASQAPREYGVVAVALDARRGEVYLGLFRRAEGEARIERAAADLVLSPEAAAARIERAAAGGTGRALVVGNAAERYPEAFARLDAMRVAPFAQIHPRGARIAELGERRLEAGEGADVDAVVPIYVHASYAEQNLGKLALTMQKAVS